MNKYGRSTNWRNRKFEQHIESIEKVCNWVRDNHVFTKDIVTRHYFLRAFERMERGINYAIEQYKEMGCGIPECPYNYDRDIYLDNCDLDTCGSYRFHWQYWIKFIPDPVHNTPYTIVEMPPDHVVEMICTWWAFGWEHKNLLEIFDWYEKHKENMLLHPNTQKLVEDILNKIGEKLQGKSKEDGE